MLTSSLSLSMSFACQNLTQSCQCQSRSRHWYDNVKNYQCHFNVADFDNYVIFEIFIFMSKMRLNLLTVEILVIDKPKDLDHWRVVPLHSRKKLDWYSSKFCKWPVVPCWSSCNSMTASPSRDLDKSAGFWMDRCWTQSRDLRDRNRFEWHLKTLCYSQLSLLDSAKITNMTVFSKNMASLTKF